MSDFPVKFSTQNGAVRCQYSCQYYMDGPVISLCTKGGNTVLKYDGKSNRPLTCDRCREENGIK